MAYIDTFWYLRIFKVLVACTILTSHSSAQTVWSTEDDGPGSLRTMLLQASDGDTIRFSSSIDGSVISLFSVLEVRSRRLVVVGNGVKNTIISGQGITRHFEILASSNIDLYDLTLIDGNAGRQNSGGAIAVTNSTLKMANFVLSGNQAGKSGGAISLSGGEHNIVELVDGVVSYNSSGGYGGGVYITGYGNVIIQRMNFTDNLSASDNLPLYGGAAYFQSCKHVHIDQCMFRSNSSLSRYAGGGAIAFADCGDSKVSRSTVSGNVTVQTGGGVHNMNGQMSLYQSTIAFNSAALGGGLSQENGSSWLPGIVSGNILAGNLASDHTMNIFVDSADKFISEGFNLIGGNPSGGLLRVEGDIVGTDPMLLPLNDSIGNGFVHGLMGGSPAIDAGDPGNFAPDQVDRPVYNGRRDIGAYEYGPLTEFTQTKPFRFVVFTGNVTQGSSDSMSIVLPFLSTAQNDFEIDWGDGNYDRVTQSSVSHTYERVDTFTISIRGHIGKWSFAGSGDRSKLLSIEEWGEFSLMRSAFMGCDSLKTIHASDAPHITDWNLSFAFSGCKTLGSFDGAGWDLSSTKDFDHFFSGCQSLTYLNVTSWDVGQIVDFNSFIQQCSSLTYADFSTWDVSSATNMGSFAERCFALDTLNVGTWNTKSIRSFMNFASGCSSLRFLDVADWDVGQVRNFRNFVNDCVSLSSLDVNQWDTRNVTTFERFVHGCRSLLELRTLGWQTGMVEDFRSFARRCTNLKVLEVGLWDMSSTRQLDQFVHSCHALEKLDVSNWDIGRVTNLAYFAFSAKSLAILELEDWSTTNVRNAISAFRGCTGLQDLNVSDWDVSNMTSMQEFARDTQIQPDTYDKILNSWAAQTVNDNVSIHFGQAHYRSGSNAERSRENLILLHGWSIVDGGPM